MQIVCDQIHMEPQIAPVALATLPFPHSSRFDIAPTLCKLLALFLQP